jgi:N utilization substance protein B
MGNRRKARECALQILFQLEFNPADPQAVARQYWESQKATPGIRDYGGWLVERILARRGEIDAAIRAVSRNWRLERMGAVDRNILRIAVCELLYEPSLVPAIVIDEAIEIAKRYSGRESATFVNGVLDAVRKRLEPGPAGRAKTVKEGKHEQERGRRVPRAGTDTARREGD